MAFILLLTLFLLSIPVCLAAVLELDQNSFESTLQQESANGLLVLFFAPWCAHCMQFKPTYEKAAKQLEGSLTVSMVNGMKNNILLSRFNIQGYPTVLFLQNNEVFTYTGPQDVGAIVAFAQGGYKLVTNKV
jgi:thioredoxin-like negative regulator of GroEL